MSDEIDDELARATGGYQGVPIVRVSAADRLEVDDATLRELTAASTSVSFNERQLIALLAKTQGILSSILGDPQAFDEGSSWNPKMLTVVTGLINAARGAIKDHNDIGTNAKHILGVLETHTKNFATATARHVTDELRDLSQQIAIIAEETTDYRTKQALLKVGERLTLELPARLRGVWRDMAKRALAEASDALNQ